MLYKKTQPKEPATAWTATWQTLSKNHKGVVFCEYNTNRAL